MGLEKITHIEGLDDGAYENVELFDDTNPTATLVSFSVESVEMVAETKEKKTRINRPFIFITKIMNLGNAVLHRRIRDEVVLDEATGKWKILSLVKGVNASDGSPRSDIKRYPNEWNAFMRGVSYVDIGSPLEVLFKADPARVAFYKARHIHTIEQLSQLTESHIQDIGLGARGDVNRAKEYMAKVKEASDTSYFHNQLEVKDAQIDELTRALRELQARFEDSLTVKIPVNVPKRRGPKPKKKEEEISNIEGL